MPIVDVAVVAPPDDPSLARRLADACGEALGTAPGRTWVRLRRLSSSDYAENGGTTFTPVFADLTLARWPDDRSEVVRAVTRALAGVLGRSAENVHVRLEPPAAGRTAFGGELVPFPEPRRATSSARWEPIIGYSRAVRVGDQVWVTGTTAFGDQGEPVGEGDAGAQARRTLVNLVAALERLGASPRDVVRTRMYLTDIQRDWEAVGRAHAEVFGEARPATTMVEVSRLIAPWMLVEIEADAVVRGR